MSREEQEELMELLEQLLVFLFLMAIQSFLLQSQLLQLLPMLMA